MWPVSVGGIADHTDLENFKLTETECSTRCAEIPDVTKSHADLFLFVIVALRCSYSV